MTSLGRLSVFLVALGVGACLAVTAKDRSVMFVILLTFFVGVLAVGLALVIDEWTWRRRMRRMTRERQLAAMWHQVDKTMKEDV